VVQVCSGDHNVGVQALRLTAGNPVLHTDGGAVLHNNASDRVAGADIDTRFGREIRDRVDDAGEPPDRIQHSIAQIEVTHQVVEARGDVRGRTKEDGGVAEDLLQAIIPHRFGRTGGERLEKEARELATPGEDIALDEGLEVLERCVEEALLGDLVGVGGGVEVGLELRARAGLDAFEQRDIALAGGLNVDRGRLALEVDTVAGVKSDEVELLVGTRTHQLVEVVEHLGHEVPGGTGVEAEPIALPDTGATADLAVRLEDRDAVTLASEEASGRKTGDAGANNDRVWGVRGVRVLGSRCGLRDVSGL
jgi:hypothetical protein